MVQLSVAEMKYVAKMNAQNIFAMKHVAQKHKTAFPDLPLAEAIQAKIGALLPEGIPDPFEAFTSDVAKQPLSKGRTKAIKRR